MRAEFLKDALEVCIHRMLGNAELVRDVPIAYDPDPQRRQIRSPISPKIDLVLDAA